MNCDKCGYALDPMDTICPMCGTRNRSSRTNLRQAISNNPAGASIGAIGSLAILIVLAFISYLAIFLFAALAGLFSRLLSLS